MLRYFVLLIVVSSSCQTGWTQDKYAVLVGIESYSGFERLEFAEDDAIELGRALGMLGFETTIMTSQQRNSALKPSNPEKIIKILQSRINSCGDGDTLVVCLSGHGIQFKDEPLLESRVRESYFCPEDANIEDKSTLIPINQRIIKMIDECKATRKLVVVDACRNEVVSKDAKKKGGDRIELNPVHESRHSVPGGMSVLFSCSSRQFSWEHKPLGHSVFSNFAINYLNGNAESQFYENREVDLDGLVFYVRKRTNDYVFNENLSPDGQMPILRGSSANWQFGKMKSPTNSIGMKMVRIPAGKFTMGSPVSEEDRDDDEFPHTVEISRSFYMSTTEVTQKQWSRVMGNMPWKGEDNVKDSSDCPATFVNWEDAAEFCVKLSKKEAKTYRLPTEAEWEYACRAGNDTAYSFDVADEFGDYAWFVENAWDVDQKFAHTVGKKRPNAWGLFDMHGNVAEWCNDFYAKTYYQNSTKIDPPGPNIGDQRVTRGGSWASSATQCRSANRVKPFRRSDPTIGFRVVLEISN